MLLLVLLSCSLVLFDFGRAVNDEWLDPFDMLNYDPSTKTMKNSESQTRDSAAAPQQREKTNQAVLPHCNHQVTDLLKQIETQKNQIKTMSQQPSCNPVFKRFLNRLLNEVNRFGGASQPEDGTYDASIKLSKQAITEIKLFLDVEDQWRTGALDNALSQILVDLRPHNYETWTWRFEDTFGVELDTVLKIGFFILIVTAIISTEVWSAVSWFLQVKRMFVICFFVSIIWNWFYLYMIAFAEHKNNVIKMDKVYETCSGQKKFTWIDNVKEWYRSTWTLQDDPCKEYHEVLMVNPILLVPPMKAISMTVTTFITDPLKHIGKGIGEFLRALLKDLPVTLQIPVLIIITLTILLGMQSTVYAVFQHGILALFRRPQRETPHPVTEPPQQHPRRIEERAHDEVMAQPPLDLRNRANNARVERNNIHQRQQVLVETLRSARTEVDSPLVEADPEEERSSAVTEPENQQPEPARDVKASGDSANTAQSKSRKNKSHLEQLKNPQLKDFSGVNNSGEDAASSSQAPERRPAEHEVQDAGPPGDDAPPSALLREIKTVGTPVQETRPTDGP